MILTLTNKTVYQINPKEMEGIIDAISQNEKYVLLQGDMIMLNAIVAIQDEDRVAESEHIRNGDYKCGFGEWHLSFDKCYGHQPLYSGKAMSTERQLESDNRTAEEIAEAAEAVKAKIRQQYNKLWETT